MGRLGKKLSLLLSTCLLCVSIPAKSDESLESLLTEFDRYFTTKMKRQGVPGAAYAVVHGEQILKIRPYGVRKRRSKSRVNAHTTFRLASVSKTFAATLAGIQQHSGAFSWQDPVVDYLPELRFKTPAHEQKLKVQHLLSHTAGFVPNAYDNLIEANKKPEQILPQFARLQPLCEPGQCYGYQNVMFNLIQPVLETSSGQNYSELMRQQIFAPLGMTDASVGRQAFVEDPNHAVGHLKLKRGWYPKDPSQAYYNFPAAAGVNASISDMAQWLLAHLGNYPSVLPDSVIDDLTQPRAKTKKDLRRRQWRNYVNHAEYGLGWRLYEFQEEPLVYHGGWVAGFRADIAYSPERKIGIAILLNAESHAINHVTTKFWEMVMKQDKLVQLKERLKSPDYPTPTPAALMLRQNQLLPYRSADF